MGNSKRNFMEDRVEQSETGVSFELRSLIDADKDRITDIARYIVDKVANGDIDPIRAFGHAKKIDELADILVANLRPYMAQNINIAKGEKYIRDNIEYTQAETGVKYDYSSTGDVTYAEIMERFNKVSEEKKEREAFLKTVKKKTGCWNPDTSESWEVTPPIKSGTLSVKTELK